MDKLFKSLKTSKRRISQQLKVATGKSDTTSDATFDLAYRRFSDLEDNLKVLSSQCVSLIHNVDTWCDTNRKLADELLRFTQKSDIQTEDMNTYKEAISNLHTALQSEYDYTRRSIICVLRAHIISRIEKLLKEDFAEVEKIVKTRKNIITDYDSHRNRCSTYEKKGDSSNAERFRMKMDHDYEMLQEHTKYLETRFEELIAIGASILSSETATLVACEMYLVQRQHEAMQTIASSFAQTSIRSVMQSVEDISERVKMGENVEMNYVAPEISIPSFPYHEPPVVTDFNPVLYQEAKAYSSPETKTQPLPPVPVATTAPLHRMVRALYSLDTGTSGELSFKEGDVIEVLKEDPSGWWEGRLNGNIGRFPSNYTAAALTVCYKHIVQFKVAPPIDIYFYPNLPLRYHSRSSRMPKSSCCVHFPFLTESSVDLLVMNRFYVLYLPEFLLC